MADLGFSCYVQRAILHDHNKLPRNIHISRHGHPTLKAKDEVLHVAILASSPSEDEIQEPS